MSDPCRCGGKGNGFNGFHYPLAAGCLLKPPTCCDFHHYGGLAYDSCGTDNEEQTTGPETPRDLTEKEALLFGMPSQQIYSALRHFHANADRGELKALLVEAWGPSPAIVQAATCDHGCGSPVYGAQVCELYLKTGRCAGRDDRPFSQRELEPVDLNIARATLQDVRDQIEQYSLGDRPSSPPVRLLREERELIATIAETEALERRESQR